jgi:chemotaxis protein MotB
MADAEHNQILVVKHHAGHQDDHHGGAWKIAFADFMTAMMALFLVLWLISSTSEKTKHTVAQYFNPVKLVEMSTLKKGFHDPKDTEMGTGSSPKEPRSDSESKKPKSSAPRAVDSKASVGQQVTVESEAALFRDPYAVLAEIAAAAPQHEEKKTPETQPIALPDVAADLFSDPFASAPQDQIKPGAQAEASPQRAESNSREEGRVQRPAEAEHDVDHPQIQSPEVNSPREKSPRKRPASEASRPYLNEASRLKTDILHALNTGAQAQIEPHIEVEETPDGVLVSLTDDSKFSMFAIGSAKPNAETVQAMEKVGRVLSSGSGPIIIRGHTDGRPYKSAVYDNWRLSEARAQIALYMLTRGGISEKRIEKVEGYADHRLKTPDNPIGSENRRIEILLRKDME